MDKKKMKARRFSRDDQSKPSKEEYAVAKSLKFKAPSKEGKFEGNNVQYFMGSKVVDFLMESKWSSKKSKTNPLFTTRSTCAAYCSRLLSKGFFCRVEKQERKKKELDKISNKEETPGLNKRSRSKKDTTKSRKTEMDDKEKAGDQSAEEKDVNNKDDSSNEEKKKKKKHPRLNFHGDQKFVDGAELYVWLYDPVPIKTFIIGLLLVVGSIIVCLFPLWPPEMKLGIYYLSCGAFGFIGVILSLCVVRVIVFVLVWLFSMGELNLWLLPNLTEDVGFVESFKPLYKINNGEKEDERRSKDETEEQTSALEEEEEENKLNDHDDDEDDDVKNNDDDVGHENKDQNDDTQEDGDDDDAGDDDEDGNESYEVIDAEDDDEDGGGDNDDEDGGDDDDDITTSDKKND